MSCDTLAREYVRCFAEADLDGMAAILAEDFHIAGPLYEFHGRDAFLARLRELNAPRARHEVVAQSGSECEASVFFRYMLGPLQLLMAMHFRANDGQLSAAILVFDTAKLPGK